MKSFLLTANDLRSGQVVFLSTSAHWTQYLSMATVTSDENMMKMMESKGQEAVDAQQIVAPFLVEVELVNDEPVPVRYRERLRVYGPSVRADFRKPVYQEVA